MGAIALHVDGEFMSAFVRSMKPSSTKAWIAMVAARSGEFQSVAVERDLLPTLIASSRLLAGVKV
jgi:hypothetical protein